MNINPINQNVFGAKFIKNAQIKQLKNQQFIPTEVSLVEIDTNRLNDIVTLQEVSKYWSDRELYASNILYTAEEKLKHNAIFDKHKIYALTKQKSNFTELNSKLVLGLAEIIEEKNNISLEHLQTDPEYAVENITRSIYGIGKCIIDSLKNIYDKTSMITSPRKGTEQFYIKNGFKLKNNIYICENRNINNVTQC